MTKNLKDSFTNISRFDRGEFSKEKNTEGNFSYMNGNRNFFSNTLTSDSTTNVYEPSIVHDEEMRSNLRNEEGYHKGENLHGAEASSWKSEVNSNVEERQSNFNYLNYFSLPLHGTCENSTQTMLTGRDIDDLVAFQTELSAIKEDLLKNSSKDKSEVIKRLFPFLNEDKKMSYALLPSEKLIRRENPLTEKNFVQMKRKNDSELKKKPGFGSFTQNTTHQSHIHIKHKKKTETKRGRKEGVGGISGASGTSVTTENVELIREDISITLEREPSVKTNDSAGVRQKKPVSLSNFLNDVVQDVKQISSSNNISSTAGGQIIIPRKDFHEEFNITEIINDIKNLSRKEISTGGFFGAGANKKVNFLINF
jgi:hypothetical protein